MIRRALTAIALVVALGAAPGGVLAAGHQAQVTIFSYSQGTGFINLGVTLPKSVDTQARSGKRNWGLDVTVTYVDGNGSVSTLDSGALSIKNDTTFLSAVDSNTDLVQVTLSFGSLSLPGNTPSFSGTATLLAP